MATIKQKRARFNALLAYGKMMDAKAHILEGYGVDSTLQLTEPQLDDVIGRVEQLVNRQKAETSAELRRWRHKCLRMIAECGVDTQDWNSVNEFMLNPRIAGTHIYELDVLGLQNLHRKLHNVRDNINSKKQEAARLASQN